MRLIALACNAFRVHDPKWSFAPVSGAGAARFGGRANRPGINALYLSLELETALAEYRQLDALIAPAMMVSYELTVDPVVDFRGGYGAGWDSIWQDFDCDWRRMVFNEKIEPPSWVIGDLVMSTGTKGILFNSVITGGSNLVLYTDMLAPTDVIKPYDPTQSLPRDQASWH
ncbi:RES family NAD+ phosphorylase [Duganella sp. FT27W]|uniref:RES family NAD+ phosphorylase n=1 Tax=Duganella sp. FT27W TaxID=2654636 RepID=UPI00128E3EDB|nr:RES family NAD+ phosphorylase [Duganella sp. FT27W]MPQ55234.1 RES domain-containing protein [Duganella sp. FT27W]